MGRKYSFYTKYDFQKAYEYVSSTCTVKNILKDHTFPLPELFTDTKCSWQYLNKAPSGHVFYSMSMPSLKLLAIFDENVPNSKCHDVNKAKKEQNK